MIYFCINFSHFRQVYIQHLRVKQPDRVRNLFLTLKNKESRRFTKCFHGWGAHRKCLDWGETTGSLQKRWFFFARIFSVDAEENSFFYLFSQRSINPTILFIYPRLCMCSLIYEILCQCPSEVFKYDLRIFVIFFALTKLFW